MRKHLVLLAALAAHSACGRVNGGASEQTRRVPEADPPSAATSGCAAVLLREPVVIRNARSPTAPVLGQLQPRTPLFLCEQHGTWWRVLFPEPIKAGETAIDRRPEQLNDCLSRPTNRACRGGWIARKPAHDVPG
jgi:hypothetical protein